MLFIMGFASLVTAICSLFPGGEGSSLALQMQHVEWDGLHLMDIIFPLFLFIAGISFPFSYANMQEKGKTRRQIYWKIFRRGLVLVLFGLLYNGLLQFQWEHLRFWSVLARIGLGWMFAALLLVNAKASTRVVVSVALLVGYWLLLRFVPAPDAPAGASPFSFEGNLVGYVDRCIFPGHLYEGDGGVFDPEGLLSTLPAIVTALLGMFTGEWVRRKDIGENKKVLWMFVAAAVLLVIGIIWSRWFPLNKKLWSSSFVLVVGAGSLALFALFYWIIDVRGWKKWSFPFSVIGMNSITIYMAGRFIDFGFTTDFFFGGLCSYMGSGWAQIVWYTGLLAVEWLFLYFLYRKKVFLRV